MSESSFIRRESRGRGSRGAGQGVLALNLRLFGSLPLFLKLLPLTMIAILLSSVAPSFYRWYSGKLSAGESISHGIPFSLAGLAWVTLLAVLLRIAAWALFEMSGMWASLRIHADMVRGLGRTRTTFFDENPSGRLINRLVRDYDELRATAIIFVGDLLNAVVEVLSIGVVAALASPWALVAIFPLLAAFAWLQGHRSAMLDHARTLSAEATGQVLGRKTDLIDGREIYLLYGRAHILRDRMAASFRKFTEASAFSALIDIWGSFWIRVSAEVFSFLALLLLVSALRAGRIDATLAGVVISALFGITGSVGWLDFATGLVSRSAPHVRRVFEFVDLPDEEQEEHAVPRVPASRTQATGRAGDIEFSRYSMSYRAETPVILDSLDLVIPAGTKVALIGATGSGKTSVTQALLRMVHVRGGDIRIGGESAFDRDLREYRRLFGVVPQFPYLFEGTLRSNLDRLNEIPDDRLETALSVVGLPLALDHPISEGGGNLSLGERQLACLARVIAADRPILIMDEPTSGLDPRADARASEVLRTAFAGRTVLTIAHRLESLAHYDQVVELRQGKVVWQGRPGERKFSRQDVLE